MNTLSFLNDYWNLCDDTEKTLYGTISANQHFLKLNSVLIDQIRSAGKTEDSIPTKYRGKKRWDLHFTEKKVLVEYKSVSDTFGKDKTTNNIHKSLSHRIEAAIGCAIDVKHFDSEYKLGYIMVFFMRDRQNARRYKKFIDDNLKSFYKMMDSGLYDFFCPLISFGKDDHEELSTVYTMDRFLNGIRDTEARIETPLTLCMENT